MEKGRNKIMNYANQFGYSDVSPCEVVKVISEKTIEIFQHPQLVDSLYQDWVNVVDSQKSQYFLLNTQLRIELSLLHQHKKFDHVDK